VVPALAEKSRHCSTDEAGAAGQHDSLRRLGR
jgi:hypothetical protein